MTVEEIKKRAYHEMESLEFTIPESLLYKEAHAIYRLYKNKLIDERTAKAGLAQAEKDYAALGLMMKCLDKHLEMEMKLEKLRAAYLKTKSSDIAVKIADVWVRSE